MKSNPCFKAAIDYVAKNISVIPVGSDKRPLISWKEYQTRIADIDEIAQWWLTFPDSQVGIVTGRISNLTVVDIEKGGDPSFLPQNTTIVKTGGSGWHYFFKFYEGTHNTARIRPLVDTRSEGGFVVAPPSVSSKGAYEVIKKAPLLPFPIELFGGEKKQVKRQNFREVAKGGVAGSRNQMAASIIGLLTHYLPEWYWGTAAWPLIQAWNEQNNPPLPEEELHTTYTSICNKSRFTNYGKRHSKKD